MSTENTKVEQAEVWQAIRQEAEAMVANEPALKDFLEKRILGQARIVEAVTVILAEKLTQTDVPTNVLVQEIGSAFNADEGVAQVICEDIAAVYERDPACQTYLDPILFFKGFLALQAYRAAHQLIKQGRRGMAHLIQNRASEVFGADIHPSAQIGHGIMIDHATGVVIGETAVIGNDVSMLHGVTLGGSGKEGGDRHPKIGNGVLISVGAKVLGNIHIGDCAKIGAGSVVLTDVPAYSTAVGIPAKVVGKVDTPTPSRSMDHSLAAAMDTKTDTQK